MKRLLAIGPFDYGTTSWSRLKTLKKMFPQAEEFNVSPYIDKLNLWGRFLTHHAYIGPNIERINIEVRKKYSVFRPQIVWIDKGLHIWPDTLRQIKKDGCEALIHFSPDNQMIKGNQSRFYLSSIPIYDLHVTTKIHNIDWLLGRAARAAEYVTNGFDADIHKPTVLTEKETDIFGCDVGFVGHWEPSREKILLSLYEKGYKVKVWGGNWSHAKNAAHPLFTNTRHLTGEEYSKAICAAKINLCLLSIWHGDNTTDRSVEIPACGKFMLAERTDEHARIFREGTEAEFYENYTEMIRKIDYYLTHDVERESIALQGRRHCISEYSNDTILEKLFKRIAYI